MATLTIRVDLDDKAAIGPGKARLLELIGETGSIRRAAAAMQMSYRRAWLLLQETEAIMGAALVATETGGKQGGGAKLTPLGRSVVERYRAIETRAARSVSAELEALARMAKRSPRRGRSTKLG